MFRIGAAFGLALPDGLPWLAVWLPGLAVITTGAVHTRSDAFFEFVNA
jgi:hypothetical protein